MDGWTDGWMNRLAKAQTMIDILNCFQLSSEASAVHQWSDFRLGNIQIYQSGPFGDLS